jgi:hypothetical protein
MTYVLRLVQIQALRFVSFCHIKKYGRYKTETLSAEFSTTAI